MHLPPRTLSVVSAVALLLAGGSLLGGCCMPYSSLRDARTIGEGNSRFGMSANFIKVGDTIQVDNKEQEERADIEDLEDMPYLPVFQGDFTYGIRDGLDLGARFSTSGLLGDLKIGLLQTDQFQIALDPTLGYGFFLVTGGPRIDLPIIFGVSAGKMAEFYAGAFYSHQWLSGELLDVRDGAIQGVTGFGGLTLEFHSVFVRFEYARSHLWLSGENADVDFDLHQPSVQFGVKWGEQINALEKRVDKLERQQQQPAPPAPGTSM